MTHLISPKSALPSSLEDLQKPVRGHIVELDSLRGIAALIVVFEHYRRFWVETDHPRWIEHLEHNPPLLLLFSGYCSVLMFFLLSGFVLTLPALAGRSQPYHIYALRRVCRIYLPYLAALALSILACWRYHGLNLYGYSFQIIWRNAPDLRTIADHLLFLGRFEVFSYDPPTWSLVHEMRISLIFPLLCFISLRFRLWAALLIAACFPLAAVLIGGIHGTAYATGDPGVAIVAYSKTLSYCGTFLLGSILARHEESFRSYLGRMRTGVRWLLCGVAVMIYLYGMRSGIPDTQFVAALGGAYLMIMALMEHGWPSRLLHTKPLRFLGRISYSLYLLHLPILLVFSIVSYGKVPYSYLFVPFLATSIAAATVFYWLIEEPSIALGKRIGRRRMTVPLAA